MPKALASTLVYVPWFRVDMIDMFQTDLEVSQFIGPSSRRSISGHHVELRSRLHPGPRQKTIASFVRCSIQSFPLNFTSAFRQSGPGHAGAVYGLDHIQNVLRF
jgi:hypothetical protein